MNSWNFRLFAKLKLWLKLLNRDLIRRIYIVPCPDIYELSMSYGNLNKTLLTVRKSNVHKTFRRRPEHVPNVWKFWTSYVRSTSSCVKGEAIQYGTTLRLIGNLSHKMQIWLLKIRRTILTHYNKLTRLHIFTCLFTLLINISIFNQILLHSNKDKGSVVFVYDLKKKLEQPCEIQKKINSASIVHHWLAPLFFLCLLTKKNFWWRNEGNPRARIPIKLVEKVLVIKVKAII